MTRCRCSWVYIWIYIWVYRLYVFLRTGSCICMCTCKWVRVGYERIMCTDTSVYMGVSVRGGYVCVFMWIIQYYIWVWVTRISIRRVGARIGVKPFLWVVCLYTYCSMCSDYVVVNRTIRWEVIWWDIRMDIGVCVYEYKWVGYIGTYTCRYVGLDFMLVCLYWYVQWTV